MKKYRNRIKKVEDKNHLIVKKICKNYTFCKSFFMSFTNGTMVTGWCQIGEKWYYFNPVNDGVHVQGALLSDTYIDGYYVGADGAWIPAN